MNFRNAEQLKTLRTMIEMLEEDRRLNTHHTYSPFINAISRWVSKVPTLCHGVDLETKCGHPQRTDEKGGTYIWSLCSKCQDKLWRANPPVLSKHEQRTIDKMEELYQKISAGGISLEDFAKAMRPLRKRYEGKDHLQFHAQQLDEKYNKAAHPTEEQDDE
tara:strand:+ start:4686 stop:5168 length:483 start_codon:yes stop_codon:yes gene_type:complete